MEEMIDVSGIRVEEKEQEGSKMLESISKIWRKIGFNEGSDTENYIKSIFEIAELTGENALATILKPYYGKYNQNANKEAIAKDIKVITDELIKNFTTEFQNTISTEKIKTLEKRRDEKDASVKKAEQLLNLHPNLKDDFIKERDNWKKEHEFMKNAKENIQRLEKTRKETEQKTGDTYRFRSYEARLDSNLSKMKDKEKRMKIILGQMKLKKKNGVSQEDIKTEMLKQFKEFNIDFDVCKSLYIDGFSYSEEDAKLDSDHQEKKGKQINYYFIGSNYFSKNLSLS